MMMRLKILRDWDEFEAGSLIECEFLVGKALKIEGIAEDWVQPIHKEKIKRLPTMSAIGNRRIEL